MTERNKKDTKETQYLGSKAQMLTFAQLTSAIDFPSASATACLAKDTFFSPSSRMSRACSSWFRGFTFSREEDSMEVRDTCWLPSWRTPRSDIDVSFTGDLESVGNKVQTFNSTGSQGQCSFFLLVKKY